MDAIEKGHLLHALNEAHQRILNGTRAHAFSFSLRDKLQPQSFLPWPTAAQIFSALMIGRPND